MLQCERFEDRKQRNVKDNIKEEWEEVLQIFREYNRKIEEGKKRKYKKKEVV